MVRVNNEWDRLREVFVGTVENANNPIKGKDLHAINYADKNNIDDVKEGYYPEQVIEETKEDLDILVQSLKSFFDIKVRRMKPNQNNKIFQTIDWVSDGYYTFCPRDSVTVIGDTIIESPMTLRSRYFETFGFRDQFIEYMEDGARWVSAPKPRLTDDNYQRRDLTKLTLTNVEPVFDAANILRCNKDILYLLSNTGNKLGAKWLQNFLGDEYKVHVLENMYSYVHIDSTIALLREGLCLLNPERVNDDNMPEILKSWDKIWCPPCVDIGYYGNFNHASTWIGLNLLSIDENTVIVDESQVELHKLLKKHNVDSLPLRIRHSRTLGGSFHCVTTDIHRQS
jgi:glycine amidinotransferase/scyllo-inosamine-4-phosphate amidinotransferase 1